MSSKLREALSKASIALSWATHHHLTEDDAKECLEVVDAALAEPPRNCDRYNSMEDAMRTFIDALRELYGKVEFGDAEWVAFFRWLFAEAKGGAK